MASEFCALDYLYEALLKIVNLKIMMMKFMKRLTIALSIKIMIAKIFV